MTAKQPLPLFLEQLDEVVVFWKYCPFSGKTQIHEALSLDFEGMKELGIHPHDAPNGGAGGHLD